MKKMGNTARLKHILDSINDIESILSLTDLQTFSSSREKQLAVCMSLTFIGEASRNLTSEFCSLHPEIPWAKIIGMRNYLVHDYIRIDYEAVWNTAQNDLPVLKSRIAAILENMQSSEK